MQHMLTFTPLSTCDSEAPLGFEVLIAYEDFETAKHAKHTYDILVKNLGPNCRFTSQMWKFAVLSLSRFRQMAVSDAVAADIIILSSAGGDLPGHIKDWIESWLAEGGNPLALVALFNPADASRQTQATRAYLADVARRGRMEFFAQPDASGTAPAAQDVRPAPPASTPAEMSLAAVVACHALPLARTTACQR